MVPATNPNSIEIARGTSVAAAIANLIAEHRNPEGGLEGRAIEATAAGRPAYWTTGTYHQSAWRLFAFTANAEGVAAALAMWVDPTWPGGMKTTNALLGSLIPLNAAAVAELVAELATVTITRRAA